MSVFSTWESADGRTVSHLTLCLHIKDIFHILTMSSHCPFLDCFRHHLYMYRVENVCRFLMYGKENACLAGAVWFCCSQPPHCCCVYSFPALSLFSSLSPGVSSSDRGFCYCSACAMEIRSVLKVLEVTVRQIIDTESSEEQHFRCKAGCSFPLGTFSWLLLQPCLPSWSVTPPEKDFLFPFHTWWTHTSLHAASFSAAVLEVSATRNTASRHPASTPSCWRACA